MIIVCYNSQEIQYRVSVLVGAHHSFVFSAFRFSRGPDITGASWWITPVPRGLAAVVPWDPWGRCRRLASRGAGSRSSYCGLRVRWARSGRAAGRTALWYAPCCASRPCQPRGASQRGSMALDNSTATVAPGQDGEGLSLWLPYLILTLVLLALLVASFIHFHCKYRERYQRRANLRQSYGAELENGLVALPRASMEAPAMLNASRFIPRTPPLSHINGTHKGRVRRLKMFYGNKVDVSSVVANSLQEDLARERLARAARQEKAGEGRRQSIGSRSSGTGDLDSDGKVQECYAETEMSICHFLHRKWCIWQRWEIIPNHSLVVDFR